MQCANCGVDMVAGAAFCPSCGRPAGQPSESSPTRSPASAGAGLQANVAGLLCYLAGFVTGIVFLVVDPYKRSPFIRFHAFQAIFLSIAWFAAYFAVGILSAILPYTLWGLIWVLRSVLGLGFLLLWLLLMYKAYNHEQFKLPVIGELAAKQAPAP